MNAKKLCSIAILLAGLATPLYAADTQWAIVIGVSDYKNLPEDQWLKYAHEDARSYMDFLKSDRVGVPASNVKYLLNKDATTVNIKAALGSWLPDRAAAGDTVYIYFAGHGIVDKDVPYFVTYDTDPNELYATAYPMQEMKQILSRLPKRHLVLIVDACNSGSIGKEARTSRALDIVQINDHLKGITGQNTDIDKSDFVLTAASSNEKSFEDASWGGGHGVFTYHLVEGLKGPADKDRNGKIVANEILDYVRENVQKSTGSKQNPVAATSSFDGNLVLSDLSSGGRISEGAPASSPSAPADRTSGAAISAPAAVSTNGTLLVTTNIANTKIYIDDDLKGILLPTSSRSFSVTGGQHVVEARRDGYSRNLQVVDVPPGRQVAHSVTMEPASPSLAPELRVQLANASKLLPSTKPKEATQAFTDIQAIFTQLLTKKRAGGLLTDEEELAADVFVTLAEQYWLKKQLAELRTASDGYLEVFGILADSMASKVSPDIMNDLQQAAAGLTVEFGPAQAIVEIDSVSYGPLAGPRTVLLRPGSHKVTVQRAGYNPFEISLNLASGERVPIKGNLKLSQINVVILSQTPGTQMARDGQPAGSLRPVSEIRASLSGDQIEQLNSELQRRGLNANQTQAAILKGINPETPELRLRFTRDKYSSQDVRVDLAANADKIYGQVGEYIWDGIVNLEQLKGTLEVTSAPSGADVFIGRTLIGKTPLSPWSTEIGDYEVTMKMGVWKDVQKVTIRDKENSKITGKLRGPVVFLGVHSAVVDAAKLLDAENRIARIVPGAMSNYQGEYKSHATYEFARDFLLGAAGATPVKWIPSQRLKEMGERFASEILVFGYFPTELDYLSSKIKFYVFSTFTTRPDIREVQLDKPESIQAFFKELDSVVLSNADLFRPYIGVTALDTELKGHEVVVLKVDEGGPAGREGLQKGDIILSINGEAPEAVKLSEWVAQKPAGSELRLEVEQATGKKTISFKSDPLPRFIVQPGTRAYVNSTIAQLEWMRRQGVPEGSNEANVALLNEALAYISLEEWTNALSVLNRFVSDEPKASILRAAVYYYKGFCFEKSNERASARQWYEMAAKEKDALLQSELAFDFQTLGSWRMDYLK